MKLSPLTLFVGFSLAAWAAEPDKITLDGPTVLNLAETKDRVLRFSATPSGDNCHGKNVDWAFQPDPWTVKVTKETNAVSLDFTELKNLSAGSSYDFTLTAKGNDPCKAEASLTFTVSNIVEHSGGLFERNIIGLEWAGGASAEMRNRAFVNLYLSMPIGSSKNPFGARWRLWNENSITTVSQQLTEPAVTTLSQNGFADLLKGIKTNEVVQAAELTAGLQLRVGLSDYRKIFFLPGLSRTSVNLVAGGGFITPIDPTKTAVEYDAPGQNTDALRNLLARFPELNGRVFPTGTATTEKPDPPETLKYLTILAGDRHRFLRQYFGGVRLQAHHYGLDRKPTTKPPTTFEALLGQNEAVLGGRLSGVSGRVGVFYPIQIDDVTIYLFSNWDFRLGNRGTFDTPLVLNPPTLAANAKVDRTARHTALLTANPNTRDVWRFGIGFDLVRTIKNVASRASQQEQPATEAAKPDPAKPKPEAPKPEAVKKSKPRIF